MSRKKALRPGLLRAALVGEEVLLARFGGTSTVYQLVEREREVGSPSSY